MALRPIPVASTSSSLHFTRMNNLSGNAKILFASDDWFAEAENLLKATEPEWKEGVYTPEGKWMDGWETRRKRQPGHDFCIIKLEFPSVIYGFECDTSYFTGNYTPCVSIEGGRLSKADEARIPPRKGLRGQGCNIDDLQKVEQIQSWKTLVGKRRLGAGYSDTCHNYLGSENRELWTHIKLNYHPDGGVARFRIFGRVKRPIQDILMLATPQGWIDLVGMRNGGFCTSLSDAHYGHPRNLILDGKTRNISDGWETARKLDRPGELAVDANGNLELYGYEYATFQLGLTGKAYRIDIDTATFKGNYPYACKVEACFVQKNNEDKENEQGSGGFCQESWKTLLHMSRLEPDTNHLFEPEQIGQISHVKVTIYPDGGLAKLRVWGIPSNF